jgi:hypothetical protein
MMVWMGQLTADTGWEEINTGIMIAIIDVSDPTMPRIVASQILEQGNSNQSYDRSEWDHTSVQYANGKLIVPATMIYYNRPDVDGEEGSGRRGLRDVDKDKNIEEAGREGNSSGREDIGALAMFNSSARVDFDGVIIFTIGVDDGVISEAFRVNNLVSSSLCIE